MNFWKKVARLGVNEKMPVYRQKSTIFFNVTMRIAVLAMLSIALLMFFVLKQKYVAIGIFSGLPLVSLSLYLNSKGKINLSVFITSMVFPIYFTAISILSKANGEGMYLMLTILPRFGIVIMTVISFVVLGFKNPLMAFAGASFGVFMLLTFNFWHSIFGINFNEFELRKEDFKIIIYGLGAIFIFIIMILSILQKINTEYEEIVNKQKEELTEQNIEITAQKDEIESQKDEIEAQRDSEVAQKHKIEKQNKEITDSIIYASRIQNAALPSLDLIANNFDLFVMFKPRDIVSGDFYWFKKVNNFSIIVTADCTGHGVPGAFVSLLGISFLNEIITEKNFFSSDEIVNLLRDKIKFSLNQHGKDGETKDGMDLSLYIIDESNLKLQFTGAQNPLYILRKNVSDSELEEFNDTKKFRVFSDKNISNYTLIELKSDRMPVGVYFAEKRFSRTDFQLQKDDLIYSLSDGYIDQFGGEDNQKFMSKNFKKLLLEICDKPMNVQKLSLETKFKDWKQEYDQLDDVLVVGLKI